MDTFWFLDFFGLDETADRSTIKKSYAKLLKQVDQKEDPEGFSELREAYEIALEWEGNPSFYEIAEFVPDLECDDRANIQDDSRFDGHIDFSDELTSIVLEWDRGVLEISRSVESQHERLSAFIDQTMNDERLRNLDNRSHFENYLISSFRDTDTALRGISFLETVRYFQWDNYSPYLEESENGRWVLEVHEEQLMWENQDSIDFYWQQIALNSFLQNVKTKKEQKAWQHLVVMARNFPLWFELWISLDELAVIAEKYSDQEDPEPLPNHSSNTVEYLIVLAICFLMLNLFKRWNPFFPVTPTPAVRTSRTLPPRTQPQRRAKPKKVIVPKTSEYFKDVQTRFQSCRQLRAFLEIASNSVDETILKAMKPCMDLGFWPKNETIIHDLWTHAEKETNKTPPVQPKTLAYQFQQPAADKECKRAFLFAHTSDWRSIPDPSAKDKFERFVESCVNEKYWLGGGEEIIAFLVQRINAKKPVINKRKKRKRSERK